MTTYDYDLIVIGGGSGGFTGAKLAIGLGKRVAMIDKGKLGGECTWSGCIPSKALIQSAKAAYMINNPEKYGLSLSPKASVKADKVMKSVQDIVKKTYESHPPEVFEKAGITVYEDALISFVDNHTVKVNLKKITSNKFLIATGSHPFVPPLPGLAKMKYYTNNNIFLLKKLPKSMIVIGGGPIGVELASAFNRLGVMVTVMELADTIRIREDRELTDILEQRLRDEGLNIITEAKAIWFEKKNGKTVTYEKEGKTHKISAEALFIAIGRMPNIYGLDLEKAGVETSMTNILVNRHMQTTQWNIFAAGDVTSPFQFSHMANYQAIAAVSNAFLPIKRSVKYTSIPWCTFTDPELARVGLTEGHARDIHKSVKVFKAEYSSLDRARTDRSETGLVKIVCDRKYKILGIHILGERAGDIIHEGLLAKIMGIPLHKIHKAIHAYPTYAEIFRNLSKEAYIDKLRNNFFIKLIKRLKK